MNELKENEITLHVYKDDQKVLGRSDRQRRLIRFEHLCNCNFLNHFDVCNIICQESVNIG